MQTIGERLEEARKRKGVSIREAADAIKIRGDYLQRFESNQFDIGLTEIYVRGFLRNYARFLQLPADRLLNDYAALGRGEVRPRQPSREVYGRMEVSVASAEDDRGGAKPPPESEAPPPEPAPAVSHRSGAPAPRVRPAQVPADPVISPTLVFKGGIALTLILAVLLIVWLAKAIFVGEPPRAVSERAPAAPVMRLAPEATFTLVALDTVQVQVTSVADNRPLYQGTLVRGQTAVVPKPGPVYIVADAGENLSIEVNGRQYPMPFKGHDRAKLP